MPSGPISVMELAVCSPAGSCRLGIDRLS